MHFHTKDTSNCANVKASRAVEEYIKAGYDGIVVTDHLSPSTYMKYGRELLSWKKKVDFLVINDLREAGAGFKVDSNRVNILSKDGVEALPLMSKEELGYELCKRFAKALEGK